MSNTTAKPAIAQTVTFALRTDDQAWIERNHGITGEDGKTFVQVPAAEVEAFIRMGRPWIRHVFADAPSDALNAAISCPAAWVTGKAGAKLWTTSRRGPSPAAGTTTG